MASSTWSSERHWFRELPRYFGPPQWRAATVTEPGQPQWRHPPVHCCPAKLFVWAGIAIKTFGTTKIEEVRIVRRKMQKIKPPILGMVGHLLLSSVSGSSILIDWFDFLFLGYFCQSIPQLDVAICRIKSRFKCHQPIKSTQSLLQLARNYKDITTLLSYDLFPALIRCWWIFRAVLLNRQIVGWQQSK